MGDEDSLEIRSHCTQTFRQVLVNSSRYFHEQVDDEKGVAEAVGLPVKEQGVDCKDDLRHRWVDGLYLRVIDARLYQLGLCDLGWMAFQIGRITNQW